MPAAHQAAITLDRVTLSYGRHPVVTDVSGAIASGTLLALVGPNGAGKSTLLKALAGLHPITSGTIGFAQSGRTNVAYMAQHTEIDRSFPLSVFDFVAMGLWGEIGWWRPLGKAGTRTTEAGLAKVGLAELANRRIGELSGGQLRRALFARTLLQDAPLILLDEPFAGVDAATTDECVALIRAWHREGRTVVVAVHDLHQVRAHFAQALLLARQVVAWGAPDKILTNENLATARTLCSRGQAAATAA